MAFLWNNYKIDNLVRSPYDVSLATITTPINLDYDGNIISLLLRVAIDAVPSGVQTSPSFSNFLPKAIPPPYLIYIWKIT